MHCRFASRVAEVSREDHQSALSAAGVRKRPTAAHDRSIIVGGNCTGEPFCGRQPDICTAALYAPKGTPVRGFIAVDAFKLASLSGGELTLVPCQTVVWNTARRLPAGQPTAVGT
jgi:hypothetical protein